MNITVWQISQSLLHLVYLVSLKLFQLFSCIISSRYFNPIFLIANLSALLVLILSKSSSLFTFSAHVIRNILLSNEICVASHLTFDCVEIFQHLLPQKRIDLIHNRIGAFVNTVCLPHQPFFTCLIFTTPNHDSHVELSSLLTTGHCLIDNKPFYLLSFIILSRISCFFFILLPVPAVNKLVIFFYTSFLSKQDDNGAQT